MSPGIARRVRVHPKKLYELYLKPCLFPGFAYDCIFHGLPYLNKSSRESELILKRRVPAFYEHKLSLIYYQCIHSQKRRFWSHYFLNIIVRISLSYSICSSPTCCPLC